MPRNPGARVWGAILTACRIHKQDELTEEFAKRFFILEPSNRSSLHVSQFNIHVDDRTWKMVENTVIYKTGELLLKSLDFTSIEVKKRLILFSFDDVLSYESAKIDYIQNSPRSEMRD
ncbi:hypothetical protein K1719_046083 [Acacia pycnantha]|nr:hypothetical protein K1719_046083 [Acacia pycnantha]